jgi:hypothetical protein
MELALAFPKHPLAGVPPAPRPQDGEADSDHDSENTNKAKKTGVVHVENRTDPHRVAPFERAVCCGRH